MTPQPIVPVILSGGTGSRLWPLSREGFPKQFWPLVSARSMIQETALRAVGEGFAPPIVVANEAHRFLVAEQLADVGIRDATILLEPEGRNSGPAIAAAAALVAERTPGAVLWILSADHAIKDLAALYAALAAAAAAARVEGRVVTFGMRATAPETSFGYIEMGAPLGGPEGAVRAVARFTEKPDAATAARLIADGRHVWNSGMFVATAATLIEELSRHAPDMLAAARAALAASARDLGFVRLGAAEFRAAPSLSIDYAVMERTDRAAVVPAEIGWSDVGSWDALWTIAARDEAGNALQGPVTVVDSRDCLIRSDGIRTAVLGCKDIVVVTTEDAVLVMPRARAQDVKKVVERLKAEGAPEANTHRKVYRPWGNYSGLILGDRFQVKQIVVRPGGRLSLQKHHHRAEHWVVVKGTARVERDGESILLAENQSVYLPLGCVHRLENPGMIPLVLIEVQVGSYLGEDDIVRIEDNYGRS